MAKKKRAGRTSARKPSETEVTEHERLIDLGFYTVEQAAELLGVLPRQVRWRCEHERHFGKKVGHRWIVPRATLALEGVVKGGDEGEGLNQRLYTVEEAAEKIGISTRLVRRYCNQGRLGVRAGGWWIIPEKNLQKFLAEPRLPGNPLASTPDNPAILAARRRRKRRRKK